MSGPRYSVIPGRFAADDRPQLVHFRVLCLMGRHTDNAGWCMRSQIKMAAELGFARETVNRAIADLCAWGYVEKTDQGGTRRSICFYRVILDERVQPKAEKSAQEGCEPQITPPGECELQITGGCDVVGHTGVTQEVTGGVTSTITPITTPVKRPPKNNGARDRARDESASAPRAKPQPQAARVAITVTDSDLSWSSWLSELEARGSPELRAAAVAAGSVVVCRRWPQADTPLPVLAIPQKSITGRMVGESNDAA